MNKQYSQLNNAPILSLFVQTLCSHNTKIKELSDELELLRAELDTVKRTRLNILSNVSHELRTPITSIKAFCDMILMFGDEDSEAREEFLNTIVAECDRLIKMINDALDISKIASGKLEHHFTTLDIAEVISASINVTQGTMQESGLALKVEIPDELPQIKGDRDELVQVIVNLLDNAAKFTEAGQVTIGAESSSDEIKIYVSDTGIGIEPEHQKSIFEEFYQVGEILTDKPKGIGLGLSICYNIVKHHGGRMWVESEPGVGSTFYFTLPLVRE